MADEYIGGVLEFTGGLMDYRFKSKHHKTKWRKLRYGNYSVMPTERELKKLGKRFRIEVRTGSLRAEAPCRSPTIP